MSDLVDIAIPAGAQAAAEALGLKVSRSVVSGVRIRQIEREDAELAIEFLRVQDLSQRPPHLLHGFHLRALLRPRHERSGRDVSNRTAARRRAA